jgi:hypothetical protein
MLRDKWSCNCKETMVLYVCRTQVPEELKKQIFVDPKTDDVRSFPPGAQSACKLRCGWWHTGNARDCLASFTRACAGCCCCCCCCTVRGEFKITKKKPLALWIRRLRVRLGWANRSGAVQGFLRRTESVQTGVVEFFDATRCNTLLYVQYFNDIVGKQSGESEHAYLQLGFGTSHAQSGIK